MNRIYQGRVTNIEIATGDKGNPWRRLEEWESVLLQHHEIFQDAINYYILALAALADPAHATSRLIQDLRARVNVAWRTFPRPVSGNARSLRDSVAKWLQISGDASLEDGFNAVLNGNEATPKIRTLALALLLDRCGGESAIQQGGRGYLPRFCDAKAKPTYDFSSVSQAAEAGKSRLSQVLHGESSEDELVKIANQMDLSWTVKLQPDEFFTPQESSARLVEALEHLRDLLHKPPAIRIKDVVIQFPDFEKQLESFKAQVQTGSREFVIPRNRKASKDLTFATLVFKFFPCSLTAKVLSLFIKKPKPVVAERSEDAVDFASCGDDPIKLARGHRGFVFRAFTALPAWNPKSPGEPVWKEFDIAAFKEALKSLNQFNQKTQERTDQESDLRGRLAIMLGSKIKGWKPRKTESNEDEPTPEPLDPTLFQLARELERDLTQDLADIVPGEEKSVTFGEADYSYCDGEWQISSASLRGFSNIADEWNGLYLKFGETLTTAQLEEVVKNHQREEKNKKAIGSIPLFLRLCEKKYWPLWLAQDEDSDESVSEKSFLASMASFHTTFRDFQRSQEPINLTPAEPRHSRRLYMFSDLTDKAARVVFAKTDTGFTVECAVAMKAVNGETKEQRVRLFYSAKRLLRDELQGGTESRWLQPMTRALGLKMPEVRDQVQFESAVSLMPEYDSENGLNAKDVRFLLNFPVTLDPTWIHSGLGKAALWKGQFNGTRDKNLHLHWPQTAKGKGSESPWWKNQQIIKNGFTCVSVDLGQRTAGAWALLRVTCSDPRKSEQGTKRRVREIGFDGDRTWFAEVLSTGIFRLPGEDQRLIGTSGKREIEPFGKHGRNALEAEWEDGKKLAGALSADVPENWLGKTFTEKSFPEQNDALIALANRRLTRLNTFHRWSCFNPDRPEIGGRRASLIQKLRDELEHWENSEVGKWKEAVQKEDFAGFRSAAGEGFDLLQAKMEKLLVMLANRVAPLRKRSWRWDRTKRNPEQGIYGELKDNGLPLSEKTWIRGQRGLSLWRIEQLENLRRLFLRYNRSFDRKAGIPAKFGSADLGRRSGEPCRLLLEKIDRMKNQRVNQTAHLILAEALGVRLREHQLNENEREVRDIHGEYEKIPGREPVDFIVIENLDRYLTSQGRAPSENSRLMKWAHRAVRDKIKMLAEEPFGIPVVEAAAAYSSKFCAMTAAAGARCEELTGLEDSQKKTLEKRANSPAKPGQPDAKIFATLLQQFEELEKLNSALECSRLGKGKQSKSKYTLFLPKQGGPLFLPVQSFEAEAQRKIPVQADINAAINIGLRALAAPDAFSILHKIRAEKEGESFKPVTKNAREKAVFDSKTKIVMNTKASTKLAKTRNPNFFFDKRALICSDSATLKHGDKSVSLVSGIGLWTAVNKAFPSQLAEINQRRLEIWKSKYDDVPMG